MGVCGILSKTGGEVGPGRRIVGGWCCWGYRLSLFYCFSSSGLRGTSISFVFVACQSSWLHCAVGGFNNGLLGRFDAGFRWWESGGSILIVSRRYQCQQLGFLELGCHSAADFDRIRGPVSEVESKSITATCSFHRLHRNPKPRVSRVPPSGDKQGSKIIWVFKLVNGVLRRPQKKGDSKVPTGSNGGNA